MWTQFTMQKRLFHYVTDNHDVIKQLLRKGDGSQLFTTFRHSIDFCREIVSVSTETARHYDIYN